MSEINPAIIFDTFNAYQKTGALKAAIELHLFTALNEGPLPPTELAERCDADARGIRILCDFLTIHGFLDKYEHGYSLTSTSAMFLDESSPRYLGGIGKFIASEEMLDSYRDVAGAVRQGGTLMPDGGSTKHNYEGWVEFARSMAPMMRPAADFMADVVAEKYPDGGLKVLDLAAGHGWFGITLARRLADTHVVAQDFEPVLEVAEENARDAGVGDMYTLAPGSAMTVDFGSGFDCVLLTNFLHHFDEATCTGLLKRIHSAVEPHGIVLTLEFVPNEDRVTPPMPAGFALTMLTSTDHGDAHTFEDYRRMFTTAGFPRNRVMDVPESGWRLIVSERD